MYSNFGKNWLQFRLLFTQTHSNQFVERLKNEVDEASGRPLFRSSSEFSSLRVVKEISPEEARELVFFEALLTTQLLTVFFIVQL